MQTIEVPTSELDPFSDEGLLDPYPLCRELRDLGPAVRLARWDLLAVTRYDDVRAALFDWDTYSSRSSCSRASRPSGILVRAQPELLASALREVLRLESPVQCFGRRVMRNVEVGRVPVPEGAPMMLSYGSANRDERRWDDPNRFDARRGNVRHLSFGYGIHACIGQGLARLEGHAILDALARRMRRFEIGEPVPHLNSLVRGLGSLPVTVVPA